MDDDDDNPHRQGTKPKEPPPSLGIPFALTV